MSRCCVALLLSCVTFAACGGGQPPVVDGWREYPLRDGVIAIHPAKWRTDTIDIDVPAGKGLEYKLTMKQGDTLVYDIAYRQISDPALIVSEFHGHTPQVDGVGDLMFYAKTAGHPQSGSFTAPWDGIHGWYLKNDGPADVVATLTLAGFYELEAGADGPPSTEAAILALRSRIAAAADANDIAALEESFTPDFTHTHAVGRVDNLAARVSALIAGEVTIEVAPPDTISIRSYGPDTAVATGQSTIPPNVFRWTVVYVRQNGAWRAAASHASPAAR